IDARERAFRAYLDGGRSRRAGYIAITLTRDYFNKQNVAVASAWLSRAERLLEAEEDSPEKAWLFRTRAIIAIEGRHDFKTGFDHATETLRMATRVKDRNLMALALHDQGRALLAMGQVGQGTALMDEATVAAVAGELSPWVTAAIYCNMIMECHHVVDVRRAGEWSDAAKRWCERQAIAGFPGMCRVYRAEVMRLRGNWLEAEQEARRACDELKEFNLSYCAGAFYELGEVRLHIGDLAGAEEAFRHAHELGRDPQPGLAMLRLAEGKTAAALTAIKSAVAGEREDRLLRVRMLPALVEIAAVAQELDAAEKGLEELAATARDYGSTALEAMARSSAGTLYLGRGDQGEAIAALRQAVRLWNEIEVPYEGARARLKLAEAFRAAGDADNAALELTTARAVFERLGAKRDQAHADELLARSDSARLLPAERAARTFMFTDIVRSTTLVEAIGDDAWTDLLRWHDQTLRGLVSRHAGEEVDHAGDGFFFAFADAGQAAECAVAIQRALAAHRRDHGFAPQVRIGLHTSRAVQVGGDYKGKGVHEAARIGALADGGEIVISAGTLAAVPQAQAGNPRAVNLKGISEPVTVYTLAWR
ncbi:MAG TPA: adenylate/guanylate cyclase domain-containing protein, partial [bacterium]